MAQLTYRECVSLGIAQCMRKNDKVILHWQKNSKNDSRNPIYYDERSKKIADDVSYFTADVTKNSECKKLVKHTIKTFGNL